MITPNIDALSLVELRYIARKQGIDDAEVLDREDLLEALQEMYEEMESNISGDGSVSSPFTQQRFMNTLVAHDSNDTMGTLPGVQCLPEGYSETRIHLLLKNPYWAHAFWSVCGTDIMKLEQSSGSFSFFLRVSIHEASDRNLEADSFDVDVSRTDTSWNINLPERGRVYSVSLHYKDTDGNTGRLCISDTVETPKSYWLDHVDALGKDERQFSLLFSSLVSKGGNMVENPLLREVVELLDERLGG